MKNGEVKLELQRLFNEKKSVIGVLLGGFSAERAISLKSGSAVAAALKSLGYPVKIIDINKPSIKELDTPRIDIAFIALHGQFGEDGEIQGLLEKKGIVYTGSGPEASRQALDKVLSKEIFTKRGILTPAYRIITQTQPQSDIKGLTYPVVVKPRSQGSSVGVSIVKKADGLKTALEQAFKHQTEALVEKHISGREVTVAVLGEEALPVIELKLQESFYNYHAKYEDELTEYIVNPDFTSSPDSGAAFGEPCPWGRDPTGGYHVLRQIQAIGLKAHRVLGCRGFSRVDMIYSEAGEPFVLEVNSIPGLTERSLVPKAAQAVGIAFPQLCERIIELALT